MHIIVLGGAGAMGRIAMRTLIEYSDIDQVTVADYNEERAQEVAESLQSSKIQVAIFLLPLITCISLQAQPVTFLV